MLHTFKNLILKTFFAEEYQQLQRYDRIHITLQTYHQWLSEFEDLHLVLDTLHDAFYSDDKFQVLNLNGYVDLSVSYHSPEALRDYFRSLRAKTDPDVANILYQSLTLKQKRIFIKGLQDTWELSNQEIADIVGIDQFEILAVFIDTDTEA